MTQRDPVPIDEPRRRDRAADAAWIRRTLRDSAFGGLATATEDGPALAFNLFVLDPARDALYLHTALHGETRDRVQEARRVVFGVGGMGRILPADAAVDFSVEYASVVVRGLATLVEDPGEANRALDLLMSKYAPGLAPGIDYRAADDRDRRRTTVLRIDIESWSGKRNSARDGQPAYEWSPAGEVR